MPRQRFVHPEIWTDETFGQLDPMGRLFFIGCFSNADDEGRLPASPAYLRNVIFPYDALSLEQVRQIRNHTVTAFRSMVLYQVDGREYIAFRKWNRYQKPKYPKPSKIPPPPPDGNGKILGEEQGNTEGTFPQLSPNISPTFPQDSPMGLGRDIEPPMMDSTPIVTQGEKEFANANSLPATELPSPPPEPMPSQLRPCPKPVKANKPTKKTKREFRPEAWDLAREIVEDMRRNDRLPARGDDTLRYASVIDSMLRARDSPVEPEDVREAWKWAKADREHAAIRTRAKGFADCIKAYLAAKKQECQYHNPAHRDVTEEALREAAEIDWGDEDE